MLKKLAYLTVFLLLATSDLFAQCTMCGTAVESNRQNGGAIAEALNSGILYLMAFPFLAMAIIGFVVYRHKRESEYK